MGHKANKPLAISIDSGFFIYYTSISTLEAGVLKFLTFH